MILNFLLPHRCFCKKIVSSQGMLCADCWLKIDFINNYCQNCGYPTSIQYIDLCEKCDLSPQLPGRSAVAYNNFVQQMILRFKYSGDTALGPILSKFMLDMDPDFLLDIDCVIPIPIHFLRLFRRGFNQSTVMAHAIAKKINKPLLTNVLYKKKFTKSQTSLSFDARADNIRNSFAIKRSEKIFAKTILIVDDIMTTGATIQECTENLLMSGAKNIKYITFARTYLKSSNNYKADQRNEDFFEQ